MTYADGYSVRSTAANLNLVANALDDLDSRITTTDWRALSETLTYASATTITVASGATSRFQVGDRLWITQTTSKYFVITGVASTTLTVFGGTDYSVANAAITSPYVSRAVCPFGWPSYFNYTPTYGAQAGSFSGTPTTNYCRASIIGKKYDILIYFQGTLTSATADYLTMTLPANADGTVYVHSQLDGQNSSFSDDCFAQQQNASTSVRIYRNDGADWAIATFFVFGKITGFLA